MLSSCYNAFLCLHMYKLLHQTSRLGCSWQFQAHVFGFWGTRLPRSEPTAKKLIVVELLGTKRWSIINKKTQGSPLILTFTITILGAPDHNYNITYPKTLLQWLRPLCYPRSLDKICKDGSNCSGDFRTRLKRNPKLLKNRPPNRKQQKPYSEIRS